jgi:hypothetical protein
MVNLFSLQFQSSVLEKDYRTKVQSDVLNKTHRAAVYLIGVYTSGILVTFIVSALSGSRITVEKILGSPGVIILFGACFVMVGVLSWIPARMSEHVITSWMIGFSIIGATTKYILQAANLQGGNFFVWVLKLCNGGDENSAMFVIDIWNMFIDVNLVAALIISSGIRAQFLACRAVAIWLTNGFIFIRGNISFLGYLSGYLSSFSAGGLFLLAYLLESKDRIVFRSVSQQKEQSANLEEILRAGFRGRLRIRSGNIISMEGMEQLFEVPVTSADDLPMQRTRMGMQRRSELIEVVNEVLESGIPTERRFWFQPRGGPNNGQKVFKTAVILWRRSPRSRRNSRSTSTATARKPASKVDQQAPRRCRLLDGVLWPELEPNVLQGPRQPRHVRAGNHLRHCYP